MKHQPKALTPKLRFPEFRESWRAKAVGELLEERPRPIELQPDKEYALVTVKRRYGGVVRRETLKGKEILVKSQFLVEPNDFLISKRQIVHNACGVVPAELDQSIVSNEYSVLTARNGCEMEFFNYFSQQPCVSRSFMSDEHIDRIIETYRGRPEKPIERYARRVKMNEIEANQYSLNISRYVSTAIEEVAVDLSATHKELVEAEKRIRESTAKHNAFLKELGLLPLLALDQ